MLIVEVSGVKVNKLSEHEDEIVQEAGSGISMSNDGDYVQVPTMGSARPAVGGDGDSGEKKEEELTTCPERFGSMCDCADCSARESTAGKCGGRSFEAKSYPTGSITLGRPPVGGADCGVIESTVRRGGRIPTLLPVVERVEARVKYNPCEYNGRRHLGLRSEEIDSQVMLSATRDCKCGCVLSTAGAGVAANLGKGHSIEDVRCIEPSAQEQSALVTVGLNRIVFLKKLRDEQLKDGDLVKVRALLVDNLPHPPPRSKG